MTRNVTVEAPVIMDYPKESEIITSPHYTLRFGASDETQTVEVSFDGGPWQACRKAGHYFWFDWAHYMSGYHEIAARAQFFTGDIKEIEVRRMYVKLEQNAQ